MAPYVRAQYTIELPFSPLDLHGQKSTVEAASVDGISLSPCGDVCVHDPTFWGSNMHHHRWKCGEVHGRKALVNSKCMLVMVRIVLLAMYVWCIISDKVFSPKFWVPNMHYRLKLTEVSVAPNFKCQIWIISGLKFEWCLSAYIWVKPDRLIEELFCLMWEEWLVRSEQYGGTKHITWPNRQKKYMTGFAKAVAAILTAIAGW